MAILDIFNLDHISNAKMNDPAKKLVVDSLASNSKGLKKDSSRKLSVLFLSADTGGGHRASAEALARQFELQYPGSTYNLLDVISDYGHPPYKNIVKDYKHLSSHPHQWNFIYNLTNTSTMEWTFEMHFKIFSEVSIRHRIKSFAPDVVISVHPLMNDVPSLSCQKISNETSTHLPFFTVVTDLGSAHLYWFSAAKGLANESRAEKIFIASDQIKQIATNRGNKSVSAEKIVQVGLPIRHDFGIESELLGDRMSHEGKLYQSSMREKLHVAPDFKTVLVMGGGEGVGSLSNIVDELYMKLDELQMNATILVICGRNEKLKADLQDRNWSEMKKKQKKDKKNDFLKFIEQVKSFCLFKPAFKVAADVTKNEPQEVETEGGDAKTKSHTVKIVPLGFVTNMAEYMVAADILVSKAGPGTIAEAAALSLPIMLTSFLPGQEEGNVSFVENHNCGAFISDEKPMEIAEKVGEWLCNHDQLTALSNAAKAAGNPNAAAEIVKFIGDSTLRWKEVKENAFVESTLG